MTECLYVPHHLDLAPLPCILQSIFDDLGLCSVVVIIID